MSAPFQEGALVKKGDVLFELDARPFQADLDSKLADVARAEAQVALARIEYNRTRKLLPQEAAAPLEFQIAEATLAQQQAVLAGAKAAVESARLNVEWCRVTAPITGRVSRKIVTVGNLVSGGGGQSTLLTTIASTDPIYCYVDADEASVLKYEKLAREGKRASARDTRVPCVLQLANEKGFPHQGVIDFVDNRVDPSTGTMQGRGVFPNPDGALTPGFFARLRVPGSGAYQAVLVPDEAVGTDQNQKDVLVVGPDDRVEQRLVQLGTLFGELRVIKSGVSPTDRVIVEGQLLVQLGRRVQPHEVPISIPPWLLTSPTSRVSREMAATRGGP